MTRLSAIALSVLAGVFALLHLAPGADVFAELHDAVIGHVDHVEAAVPATLALGSLIVALAGLVAWRPRAWLGLAWAGGTLVAVIRYVCAHALDGFADARIYHVRWGGEVAAVVAIVLVLGLALFAAVCLVRSLAQVVRAIRPPLVAV